MINVGGHFTRVPATCDFCRAAHCFVFQGSRSFCRGPSNLRFLSCKALLSFSRLKVILRGSRKLAICFVQSIAHFLRFGCHFTRVPETFDFCRAAHCSFLVVRRSFYEGPSILRFLSCSALLSFSRLEVILRGSQQLLIFVVQSIA